MAVPIKGAFRERFSVPYAGAGVWGTGYSPVHSIYGSPPARQDAINPREGQVTPPFLGVPEEITYEHNYDFTQEDSQYNQAFVRDDRPGWDVESPENPSRYSTDDQPPLNATGAAKTAFRSRFGGAFSAWRGKLPRANYMIPSETVSEGWVNKEQGRPGNAKPSDPSQYERQTSMQQRYRARNNDHAVMRGTDAGRSHINSRVAGQIVKRYSEGLRHYDMFPFQQTPETNRRAFFYRTAGTGLPEQMQPNEMWTQYPLERTPAPDPYIGPPDVSMDYGYTSEDNFYA